MQLIRGSSSFCRSLYFNSLQVELHGRALLPVGAEEQVVVVRDDEPTSIVAYFLSTRSGSFTSPLMDALLASSVFQSHVLKVL